MSTMFLRHLDSAFNLARWLVGTDAVAEDIVQAAFSQALEPAKAGRPRDPRLLLLGLVRETSYQWLNRRGGDSPVYAPPPAAGTDARQVGEVLQALPVRLREMLVLRELERLEYREISDVVGLPIPAVLSTLSAARQRFHALSRGAAGYDASRARTNAASSASSRSETAQNDRSPCVQ